MTTEPTTNVSTSAPPVVANGAASPLLRSLAVAGSVLVYLVLQVVTLVYVVIGKPSTTTNVTQLLESFVNAYRNATNL